MYLLRMDGGLPHLNWKSKWSGSLSASRNNPQIQVPNQYRIRQRPCLSSLVNSTGMYTLNIKWKLHTAYRPQSSGMVEQTNRTLKETLSKWIIETDCSWMDLLPMAVFRLRMTPWSHDYSPYETVYGRSPPTIKEVSTKLSQVRGDEISQQMEQLGKVINQVTKFVQESMPFPLG